jgi:mono/diheme cytochrome c family protein
MEPFMLNGRRAAIIVTGVAGLATAGLLSCEGPQPLDRAINPADESAYRDLQSAGTETPGQAFLRMRATDLGVTVEEARQRDSALSTTANPFNARRDQSAVSRGAVIYSHECVACHGENVDGRGPALPIAMPSLDFHRTTMRLDITAHGGAVKSWFRTIQGGAIAREKGPDGSPITLTMPAFENRLAREQIWLVITYLQSLDTDLPASAGEPTR